MRENKKKITKIQLAVTRLELLIDLFPTFSFHLHHFSSTKYIDSNLDIIDLGTEKKKLN